MKNEALEVLKNRRSIRKFKSQQIPDEALDAILEAGTFAPTGGGCQSPVIVAVQNPKDVKKLSEMNAKVMGKDTDPYYGAPTILIVLAESKFGSAKMDGSSVMTNLLNAAYATGLGSCWIAREPEMFASPEGKALLKQWGLEGDYIGIGGCAVGYADCEQPVAAPRKANYIVKVK